MADLPRYEKWALLLTAGFILFTGGWFLAGHSSPEPYTITAAHPGSSASLQPAASGSMDGSRPDSLLEGEVIDLNTAAPEDLERLPASARPRRRPSPPTGRSTAPFSRWTS